MKWRIQTETFSAPHTREGMTEIIERKREIRVPVLPRDWDTLSTRAAVGLVMALTLVSVVWSTWSIGSLLGGGIGFAAAGVFDLAWAVCLILEWKARFEAAKRAFPRRLGWWLLAATMGAIFWHGWEMGSVSLAVTGAAVSAFAKTLWLGVMRHIDKDLSDEDAQWVAKQISAANAEMAIASVRRQAARIKHLAAAELLAMEAEAGTLTQVSAPDSADASADSTDAPEETAEILASAPQTLALPAQASEITPETLAAALALLAGTGVTAGADAPAAGTDAPQAEDDAEPEPLEALEPPTLSHLRKSDAIRIAARRRPDATPVEIAALLAGYDVSVTADYVRQVQNRDREAAVAQTADGEVVPIRKTL
jgi:hypothetical protein